MPDFAMCGNGVHCPSRNDCYRYTAEEHPYRQVYTDFYLPGMLTQCSFFYPTTAYLNKRREIEDIEYEG